MNTHFVLYGDVWASLSALEDESVDCAITSPPYWSQRDYGFHSQIGNEKTLKEYLQRLITVFKLLKDKLKLTGVFYLNIGDKYISKYGNSPLAMIPYIMAYFLTKNGWILEDIQIWMKTNHMPSSVKNRFTNTYEPIFVFVKNEKNYYSRHKQKKNGSNILKIPLQPLPYKHMATFPEKLVESLLAQGLPNDALILDPFAGSGTTCKATQKISEGYFNPIKMSSIMIESFGDYIEIIKKRCKLKNKDVKKITLLSYKLIPIDLNFKIPFINSEKTSNISFDYETDSLMIKIFTDPKKFTSFIPLLFNKSIYKLLEDDGLLFLGLPNHDIKNLYVIAQLNKIGWIIRNMIVVPRNNDWFPIFMIVKDIKSVKYKFNLDAARIAHKQLINPNWEKIDFIGYHVEKSQSYFKESDTGRIIEIISTSNNGLPKWVLVKWDRLKAVSLEEVVDGTIHSTQIEFYCPSCGQKLRKFYHYKKIVKCSNCTLQLWQDITNIPILKEIEPRKEPEAQYTIKEFSKKRISKLRYSGKFKNAAKINLGQSPGARVSVNELYFSIQRYYNVKQSMISDFLNLYRKNANLSKKELTDKFPSKYKHTCGHWLRKDMGGSIPKNEDLIKLKELLDLDEGYVNYISRMGLKLQTVIAEKKGKNPGDFLDYPNEKVLEILKSVAS